MAFASGRPPRPAGLVTLWPAGRRQSHAGAPAVKMQVPVKKLPTKGTPLAKPRCSHLKHVYSTKAGGFEVREHGRYIARFGTEREAAASLMQVTKRTRSSQEPMKIGIERFKLLKGIFEDISLQGGHGPSWQHSFAPPVARDVSLTPSWAIVASCVE